MKNYLRLPLASVIKQTLPSEHFEQSAQNFDRLKTYSNVLLNILGVAGIVTMAVLAPNALQALELFQKHQKKRPLDFQKKEKKLIRAFYYLRNWGHIELRRKGNDYQVVLTEKGQKQVKKLNFEILSISKPAKWEGGFWQVAADIPTKNHRRGADALRRKLKQLGFFPLQRTLWFYPYDPRAEVELIARTYGIANFVTTMKISQLDLSDQKVLIGYFKKSKVI